MTCRHAPGDPNCSSNRPASDPPATPDAENYTIEDVARVGNHLVLKVRYPNCAHCAYEGHKVMVYLNVSEAAALRWRRIDPHFRTPHQDPTQAPSPAARFPGSKEGWKDALAFAHSKGS